MSVGEFEKAIEAGDTPDLQALMQEGSRIQREAEGKDGGKFCTHCGFKKPKNEFHKDAAKPDGYRDVCKACRMELAKEKQDDKLKVELEKMERESVETLKGLSGGGSFDPHINEVFESIMRPFGGVNGWAKHLFATYLAAPAGSQKRIKIHEMMMNLAAKVTKLGLAERQLDMMEERDLVKVMQQHLTEYQNENSLSNDMIPTIEGGVVSVETDDQPE